MGPISPNERLTRYIFHRSNYRPTSGTVKYTAFYPPRNDEISVFRISSLRDTRIWNMGNFCVAYDCGRVLVGRADILTSQVCDTGLNVQPEPVPHPRHANITAWPEKRPEQMLYAKKLEAVAQLRLVTD